MSITGKRIQQLKRILRLGRPRTGQKYFSCSFSVTREQKEFLEQHPNASEQLRKLIDSVMQVQDDFKSKFPVLVLKHQIDTLQARADELYRIRFEYYTEHKNEIWERVDNENGVVYMFEGSKLIGEKPATVKQTENVQYHYKIWKTLGEEQEQIQAKVKELKEKIIHHHPET